MLIFTHKAILRRFLENIKHDKSAVPDFWTLSLFVFPFFFNLTLILYILYKIHTEKHHGESQRFTISNLKSAQVTLDCTSQFKNYWTVLLPMHNGICSDVAIDRWKILCFQDFNCSVNLEYCKMVTQCLKVIQLKCGISVVKPPSSQQKNKGK